MEQTMELEFFDDQLDHDYATKDPLAIDPTPPAKTKSKKQIGVSGKIVQAQSREIIANVLSFMKMEAVKGAPVIPLESFKQRVIKATGVSEKIYKEVCRDMKLIERGEISTFSSPSRGQKAKMNSDVIKIVFE